MTTPSASLDRVAIFAAGMARSLPMAARLAGTAVMIRRPGPLDWNKQDDPAGSFLRIKLEL